MPGPHIASAEIDVSLDSDAITSQAKRIAAKAGREFGDGFGEEADDGINKQMTKVGRDIRKELEDAGYYGGQGFGKKLQSAVKGETKGLFDDIIKGAATGDWDKVAGRFESVGAAVEGVSGHLDDLADREEITAGRAEDLKGSMGKWAQELDKEFQKTRYNLDETDKSSRTLAKSLSKFSGSERSFKSVSRAVQDMRNDLEKTGRSRAVRDLQDMFKNLGSGAGHGIDDIEKALARVDTAVSRTSRSMSSAGGNNTRFGIFSKLIGSRNDAANGIGIIGGSLEKLANFGATKSLGLVSKGLNSVSESITKISGESKSLEGVSKIFSQFSSVLEEAGAGGGPAGALIGIGVAIQTAVYAAQTLAGGLSVLAGIATALAAVLANALLGALVALLPIIGAVAAGVGTVALAASAAGSSLTKAIEPLKAWVKSAGKVAAANLFKNIGAQAKTLAGTLKTEVTPLLASTATAISKFGDRFNAALGSSGMKRNMKVFSDTWPKILGHLLDIATDLFTGLAGVAAAVSPAVEKVTGKISDLAKTFSDWANSVSGQKTISHWFDTAAHAAGTLWDILLHLGDAIGHVFSQGNATGQGFLDSIDKLVQRFDDWTKSVKGQKAIQQWFADAKTAAGKLADVIGSIGRLFDKLDTKQTRKQFDQLLGGIGHVIDAISTLYSWWEDASKAIMSLPFVSEGLNLLKKTVSWFMTVDWKGVVDGVGKWFSDLGPNIVSGIESGWGAVTSWFSNVGSSIMSGVTSGWDGVVDWFAGLGASVVSGIESGWGAVTTWFSNMGSTIVTIAASGWGAVTDFFAQTGAAIVTGIESGWGAVTKWFSDMGAKIAGIISSGWSAVIDWFAGLGAAVVKGVTSGWGAVTSWFAGIGTDILDALSSGWSRITGFFSQAGTDASASVTSGFGKIVDFYRKLPGRIVAELKALPAQVDALFWKTWTTAWGIVGDVGSSIVDAIVDIVVGIEDEIHKLPGQISGVFTGMWSGAKSSTFTIGGSIVDWFTALPGEIGSALSSLASTVGGWFSSMWSSASSSTFTIGGSIVTWVTGLPAQIGTALAALWTTVTGAFSSAWNTAYAAVVSFGGAIIAYITGLPAQIATGLGSLAGTVGSAFAAAWNAAYATVVSVGGSIVSWVAGLPGRIGSGLASLGKTIGGVFTSAWNGAKAIASSVGSAIVAAAKALPGRIASALGSLASTVGGAFRTAWNAAKSTVVSVGGSIVTWVSGLAGKIGGALGSLGSTLAGAFRTAWDTAYRTVTTEGGKVLTWFRDLPTKIKGSMSGASTWLIGVGEDVVRGLVTGIGNLAAAPVAAIKKIAGSVISGAKKIFASRSPSKVFIQIGKDVSTGLSIGIVQTGDDAVAATKKVSDQVVAVGNDMVKDQANKLITSRKEANDRIRAYNQSHKKDLAVLPSLNMTEATAAAKKQLSGTLKVITDFSKKIAAQGKLTKNFKVSSLIFDVKGLSSKKLTDDLDDQATALAKAVSKNKVTLKDLAKTRDALATQIKTANDNLAAAVKVRDDFKAQVIASAQDFASALQATPAVDGDTLVSSDVIKTMQDRLAQLKTFRANIAALTAKGLNKTTLQQIVSAGVDQGGSVAAALAAGGKSAVSSVNDLQSKINSAAKGLGTDTSSTFYQAGVDSAKGIVNGLKSQNSQVVAAMNTLATNMLKAFKKKLGIKSPSRVFAAEVGVPIAQGIAVGALSQRRTVDAAVRAVATPKGVAVQVGGTGSGSGGGRSVVIADGAIRVTTQVADPRMVANKVLDALVTKVG